MRIGSIVECVARNNNYSSHPDHLNVVVGDVYTVRDFTYGMKTGVLSIKLEERPTCVCFDIRCFREIEIPPAITEQINESLKAPEVETFARANPRLQPRTVR